MKGLSLRRGQKMVVLTKVMRRSIDVIMTIATDMLPSMMKSTVNIEHESHDDAIDHSS